MPPGRQARCACGKAFCPPTRERWISAKPMGRKAHGWTNVLALPNKVSGLATPRLYKLLTQNPTTSGETTLLGAAKPTWVAVKHGDGDELYWWCPQDDATTAVGDPRPREWEAVETEQGESYWWCPETGRFTH